ncbi:MAG: pilus assembly protein TadG-related protein [Acidimicrobiales bacterium]
MRSRDNSGQVTVFVVGIMAALLLLAGLVIDGGDVLATRQVAIDNAQAAARAGAQAISIAAYRSSGNVVLDVAAAKSAADAYLRGVGETGNVAVSGETVTVTVHLRQRLAILSVVGIPSITVTGTGSAVPVLGPGAVP